MSITRGKLNKLQMSYPYISSLIYIKKKTKKQYLINDDEYTNSTVLNN